MKIANSFKQNNNRRLVLVRKKIYEGLTQEETKELEKLTKIVREWIYSRHPPPCVGWEVLDAKIFQNNRKA